MLFNNTEGFEILDPFGEDIKDNEHLRQVHMQNLGKGHMFRMYMRPG